MKKVQKGTNGYIDNKKLRQSLYVLFILAVAIGLFVIGYVSTGSSQNLLTVVAVLAVLPGAKALIHLFLFIPHRTFDAQRFQNLAELAGEEAHVYSDLVFTSSQHVMHLDFLCIYGQECIGYVEKESRTTKYIADYFTESMKKRGISVHMHVFTTQKDVEKRLRSLHGANETVAPEIPKELTDFVTMILA